jgi:primary-amine oxidase
MYAIVNKEKPNKYGEYPGYRIRRAAGTSHLTVVNSSNTGNAAHYATHDLYITKQKDTEPRAADPYNGYDTENPLVDFSKFLDGESLDQEDLYVSVSYLHTRDGLANSSNRVLWFNLGMHHIPHTGDLPNTLMTSAHSAIRLEPLNYLDGDPSMATSQQVRVYFDKSEVRRFGAKNSNCSVNLVGSLQEVRM